MPDKTNGKKNKRGRLARLLVGLGSFKSKFLGDLSLFQILVGLGTALLITLLLVGYQFQNIPEYQVGDIADRTVDAPYDFTVEDHEATIEKRQRALEKAPVVFEFDLRLNQRVESEVRHAFAVGRQALEEERARLRLVPQRPLPKDARDRLILALASTLHEFDQPRMLGICIQRGFSIDLENQLVKLMAEAMKYPGVVENRDLLLRYQSRGVMLRNTVTSRNERLNDWMAVRDLSRARDVLRQNAYELTAVGGEEKKALIAWLDSWIRPNVRYSEAETRALEQAALQQVDPVVVQVKKGRTIVRTGDEITSQTLAALKALMGLKQPHRLLGKILGIFALVAFFLLVLWKYLVTGPGLHEKARAQYVLLTTVLLIGLLVARLFVGLADTVADRLLPESFQNPSHFYLVSPWAFGAILVVLLTSGQTAVLFSLMFSVFSGLLTGQVSMTAYSLTGCMVASYLLDHYRERLAIVRAGVGIGLASVIAAVSLQFYTSAPTFSWEVLLVRVVGAFFSGLFAAMLASILLPILESWFEITTDIRLLELSNLNKPVLRRLAVEAPGTYHHSIVVGTLGEAAAEAISANPLLVRVGAYYHDIGKLKKPGYYVENQIYCSNKHENLAPSMSSLVLASHVKDGLAIADEIGLAPRVRDMIPQHHGTRVMTYFYQKAKEEAEEKRHTVSEDDYRYPGPKPQSKEAAILMLADQVEAASRTLQDPNPGQIQGMIRRLIQATIQDGQLEECDITMRELEVLAQAFERVLAGMYHHRIEYPGFTFNVPLEEKRPESQRIQ